ncbi:hypothetical protein TWF696_000291 [Orbilia brochopaga]|uniref:Uncharacterized protein n=1 Tax=Orbilia brochopaga TaxID=3140254 RepID=A0AAV9VH87_9PEZI
MASSTLQRLKPTDLGFKHSQHNALGLELMLTPPYLRRTASNGPDNNVARISHCGKRDGYNSSGSDPGVEEIDGHHPNTVNINAEQLRKAINRWVNAYLRLRFKRCLPPAPFTQLLRPIAFELILQYMQNKILHGAGEKPMDISGFRKPNQDKDDESDEEMNGVDVHESDDLNFEVGQIVEEVYHWLSDRNTRQQQLELVPDPVIKDPPTSSENPQEGVSGNSMLKPDDHTIYIDSQAPHAAQDQIDAALDGDISEERIWKFRAAILHLLLLVINVRRENLNGLENLKIKLRSTSNGFCSNSSGASEHGCPEVGDIVDFGPGCPTSGNSFHRNHKRPNVNDDKSNDEEDPDPPRKRRAFRTIEEIGSNLACPFAKGQPDKYPECLKINRKNLAGIREHLKRNHFNGLVPHRIARARSWAKIFECCNPGWPSSRPIPSSNYDPVEELLRSKKLIEFQRPLCGTGPADAASPGTPITTYSTFASDPQLTTKILSSLESGNYQDVAYEDLFHLNTSLSSGSGAPGSLQEHVQSGLSIDTAQTSLNELSSNIFQTLAPFNPQAQESNVMWYQSDAYQALAELDPPFSSLSSSLASTPPRPASLDFHSTRQLDRGEINAFVDSDFTLSDAQTCESTTGEESSRPTSGLSLRPVESLSDSSEFHFSQRLSDALYVNLPDDLGLDIPARMEKAPGSVEEKKQKKKYILRIARKSRPRKQISSESSRPKDFCFDEIREFEGTFEIWMKQRFFYPMFSWDAWEFENPVRQERLTTQDELIDELQFMICAYRTETVAFFLVPKEVGGAG